jgi:hypothetical protein
MVTTLGCGVLMRKRRVSHVAEAKKEKFHTEREVIDEHGTRKNLCIGEFIPSLGSDKQPIVTPVYLISICHGEDQLPLKAEHLPNISGK